MNITIAPGTYVIAVSGGVDSMVLLDILRKLPGVTLVVAHFDHGIRNDSMMDKNLVQSVAQQHALSFVTDSAELGAGASEDVARQARYKFLHTVKQASNATAIITAHHHNDVVETAVLNLMRGTNRKGLSSLRSTEMIHRPFLHISKRDIRAYALDQGLVWREDSTNADMRYVRNHVRHNVIPMLTAKQYKKFSDLVSLAHDRNYEIDGHLQNLLHIQPAINKLDRKQFIALPHAVARELMAAFLRKNTIRDFDEKTLERIVINAKTLVPGKRIDIRNGTILYISQAFLALKASDR